MTHPNDYKLRLEAGLIRIETELSQIAHHHNDTDDWEAVPDQAETGEADENIEADAVEEWNERRATVAALETEYRDIKRALAKLATGDYGRCEIGGEEIEEDRLTIKPTARTCKAHREEEGTLSL